MNQKLPILASLVLTLALTGIVNAQTCLRINRSDCSGAPMGQSNCYDKNCIESTLYPGNYYCPSETTGCKTLNGAYDGFYYDYYGFNSYVMSGTVVCVKCGDCEGCYEFSTRCKEDDPENWTAQETLFQLTGMGNCP
jgi:hypothetical protein